MPRGGWWASDTKTVPGRVKWTGKTHPWVPECIMEQKGSPGMGVREAGVLVDSGTDSLALLCPHSQQKRTFLDQLFSDSPLGNPA